MSGSNSPPSGPSNHHAHLRPSGGYRDLRSFRIATLIYDATVSFCARFVDPRTRMVDQMVQAARSGRQNIAEGSRASAASSQTELRLVSVARASLDELLLDYEDFLRQRHLAQWTKESSEARAVRKVGRAPGIGSAKNRPDPSDRSDSSDFSSDADPAAVAARDAARYAPWLQHREPAVVANAVICLIHQANYLLDRQLASLEQAFIRDGGYTENLAAARLAARSTRAAAATTAVPAALVQSVVPDRSATPGRPTAPNCPVCGRPMALRTARKGPHAGSQFWGCSTYPTCRGSRPV